MKKPILFSLSTIILVAIISGFAASKSTQPMSLKMHIKDLSKHGLKLIGPSDPGFDEKIKGELKGKSDAVIEAVKPFSVFLENTGDKAVVAYVVQWCFTRADGTNQYYRKAVMNPEALMQGEPQTEGLKRQAERIEVNSSRLLALLSIDGSGIFRARLSPSEAEAVKNGTLKFDRASLLERFRIEAAQYTDITVSVDGAFFDDGTFVGPDTSNFFSQTKAAIDAKRNLLEEIANDITVKKRARSEIYKQLEETTGQATENLDSESSPADYYRYFRGMYANEILQMKAAHGEDKALAFAMSSLEKRWAKLSKKD